MQQTTLKLNDLAHEQSIACGEQPQQRFEAFGASALSDTELIAILLGNGHSALRLASKLIGEAGSIAGLVTWRPEDYRKLKGIGPAKGIQLAALTEVGRRIMAVSTSAQPQLNRADLIADYMGPIVKGLEIEKFWVVCLNRKNRLKKLVEVTSGTATAALAHPREVFRAAIQHSAAAVVCVHNHPSGDPAPSAADIQVTRQLREAARALDIQLLDHVVIGTPAEDPIGTGHYSFRAAGLL